MDDQKLTQEEVNEATAYFYMASLLGRAIEAAAHDIKYPAGSSRIECVTEEDEKDEPEKHGPHPAAAIHSGEGSIDDQINQLIAMYTPGLVEFLRRSCLPDMFHIACEQFDFDISDPAQELSPEDRKKAAIAWVIVKRVFTVRHTEDAYIIISATEAPIRQNKSITFQPLDEMDIRFITETCALCQKVLKKDMPLPEIFSSMEKEFKRAEKAEKVGRLAPLGSMPNGEALGWLYRVVANKGDRLRRRQHESIIESRKGDAVRYTRTNKQNGTTITVEIAQADKYLSKTSKTFKKLLLFTLQKMNAQNFPLEVGFSLQELVDLGVYTTTSNALRGVKEFFAQQKQTMLSGSVRKGRKTIKEEGGILFYHYQLENGYVKLSVNENFNMEFISNYYTVFPRFAYALSKNAFDLICYIFALARQNTKDIKDKGSFTIGLDTVRENLGLPAPEEVKNRRYKQLIIEPIEQAIEEIETALQTVPEAKDYGFTITPICSDSGNINKWLEGYLEIGLQGDFAETFIKLATKAEADRERWTRIKNAELAKLAARKEAEEAKAEDQ